MAPRRILLRGPPAAARRHLSWRRRRPGRYQSDEARRTAGTEAHQAAAALQVSLDAGAGQVGSLAGLFDASSEVTAPEFARFSRRLLGTGGLSVVTWIERVPRAQRADYERRTGHPIVAALAGREPGRGGAARGAPTTPSPTPPGTACP